MITMLLSAALVATTAGAYVHGHALGMRQVEAELQAIAAADARRPTDA